MILKEELRKFFIEEINLAIVDPEKGEEGMGAEKDILKELKIIRDIRLMVEIVGNETDQALALETESDLPVAIKEAQEEFDKLNPTKQGKLNITVFAIIGENGFSITIPERLCTLYKR